MCHYRKDFHETSHEGNPATFSEGGQRSAWISFNVTEDQDVLLELTQMSKRLFPGGCTGDEIPQGYGFLVYDSNVN